MTTTNAQMSPFIEALRAPFERAHTIIQETFEDLDPTGAIIDDVAISLGKIRDENGAPITRPTQPAIALSTRHADVPAHQQVAFFHKARMYTPVWRDANLPILEAIMASMPILQGPESMITLTWVHRRVSDLDMGGRITYRIYRPALTINHHPLKHNARHDLMDIPTLLGRLDAVATTTAACAPATRHLTITAPGIDAGTRLSAATDADAQTFLKAMDPCHWDRAPCYPTFQDVP